MSHLVTIATQVREPTALTAACTRLKLPAPLYGEFPIYRRLATGYSVLLRDWRYPVVCNTDSGELHYDNFSGLWGNPARLDELVQAYAVEHATLVARRQGYSVLERALPTGAIQLTLTAGGAA